MEINLMKLKHYALHALMLLLFMALPACETMPKKPGANAMRIWIAPAYRENTSATQSGHLFVNLDGESTTGAQRNHKPAPARRY